MHLRLYIQRAQDDRYKFSNRWPSADNRTFMFRNQTRDNVFWTLVSGGLIWTAYEAVTLWLYANGVLPTIAFAASPVYFVLLMLAIPLLATSTSTGCTGSPTGNRCTNRHTSCITRTSIPGRGPVCRCIPSSTCVLQRRAAALGHPFASAARDLPSHARRCLTRSRPYRFFKIEVSDEHEIKNGGYFHYLHHKYFDCNYGGEIIPLDKWFGSFFDGSSESEVEMRARRRRLKGVST